MSISIYAEGENRRLLAQFAVLVAGLTSDGKPVPLRFDGDGNLLVASGSAPVGAATEAKQDAQITVSTKTLQFQCGQTGSVIGVDTDTLSGNFTGFVCLQDTIIDDITSSGLTGIEDAGKLVGLVLPAGTQVWGVFTELTLTSGAVQAFNWIP